MARKSKADEQTAVKKFTKAQFVKSKRFANRRDILNALLDEKKEYSIAEPRRFSNTDKSRRAWSFRGRAILRRLPSCPSFYRRRW